MLPKDLKETSFCKKLSINYKLLGTIVAIVITLDQISKTMVKANMHIWESIPREGFFRITYATNTGSAFGLFSNQNLALIIASFVGIAVLLYFYRSQIIPSILFKVSLGLQLGGAIGNLIDRLTLGWVVDFVDVGPWPIFNVADSSLVIGIAILAWIVLFSKKDSKGLGEPQITHSSLLNKDEGSL